MEEEEVAAALCLKTSKHYVRGSYRLIALPRAVVQPLVEKQQVPRPMLQQV